MRDFYGMGGWSGWGPPPPPPPPCPCPCHHHNHDYISGNDDYEPGHKGGCLLWVISFIIVVAGIMWLARGL